MPQKSLIPSVCLGTETLPGPVLAVQIHGAARDGCQALCTASGPCQLPPGLQFLVLRELSSASETASFLLEFFSFPGGFLQVSFCELPTVKAHPLRSTREMGN